jgi:hypothetical protein
MKKVDIALKEVEVVAVDKVNKVVSLFIRYSIGNKEKTTTHSAKLTDPEEVSEIILKKLRDLEGEQGLGFGDDILSGITITSIVNEDIVSEKLSFFLSKFKEKLKDFERTKVATNYLNKLHDMKNQKVTF